MPPDDSAAAAEATAGRRARPWLTCLAVAAVYLLLARLAALLAHQPGYATPFWPSAGAGLTGVLLAGPWALPGVFLGALGSNLWHSYDELGPALFGLPVAAAALIACGASLQAWAGARLLVRARVWPSGLDEGRAVLLYVFAGAGAGCLVNASWGPLVLRGLGLIPPGDLVRTAFTWWLGDTLGVLVSMPLLLALFAAPRAEWRRRLVPICVPLLSATAVSIFVFVRASAWERERLRVEVERSGATIEAALTRNLQLPFEAVYALRAFWEGSPGLTREQFHRLASPFVLRNPGLQALSFAPLVTAAQRAALEEAARAEGLATFVISDRDAAGVQVPAAARARYQPVLYLEPPQGNEAALGFDLLSSPERRRALERSAASDALVATGRLTLVQELARQQGVLVTLPLYQPPHPQPEEREAALRGHVIAVFRLGRLVEEALAGAPRAGLQITLRDLDLPQADGLLYQSEGEDPPPVRGVYTEAARPWSRTIEVAGRRWLLEVVPGRSWLAARQTWQAWAVLIFALLLVGMLGAFLLLVTGRQRRVEQQVAQRTAELAATVEGLRAARQEVQASLGEKEVLLKEIHHRVKNNLQLIISLLSLQSRYVRDPRARELLEDSQNRVRSVGLVHEQLYRAHDLAHVAFDAYVRELCSALVRMGSQGALELEFQLEPCALGVDQAIPCGLLLSELVTNALKHAFVPGRAGKLTVGLRRHSAGKLELLVSDNGIGLPEQLDPKQSSSLGMELIHTLAEQLGGHLRIERTPRTCFSVVFPAKA
jgi:two-component sensor histidine kinase/integral membrane sensor domain MASE1